MALAFLGNVASKIAPALIGWGAQQLGGRTSLGGKVVHAVGNAVQEVTKSKDKKTYGLTPQ